jgi:hypothetical protein
MNLPEPGETYAVTRDALHAVAEHVLAPVRLRAERRIGLTPTPGGFGTPPLPDGSQLRVDGTELVARRSGREERVPITTLAAAAAFAGAEIGAVSTVYSPATDVAPDASLLLEPADAAVLATWFEFGAGRLGELASAQSAAAPSPMQLWPEHFDLALDLGDEAGGTRANYGASPGDGAIAEPYLYVGPWAADRRTGRFAAYPWGAACTLSELRATADPVAAAREFFAGAAADLLEGARR